MVDLHCHILPYNDDGAENSEEAIKLAQLEIENGVDEIAVTPHFKKEHDSLSDFLKWRELAADDLKARLSDAGINLRIIEGAEVYLTPSILNTSDCHALCYKGTHYILVELPLYGVPHWVSDVLYQIRLYGITPIIAHAERYPYIAENPKFLYELVTAGSLAQINADSIACNHSQQSGIFTLLKHNLIQIIASDTHSINHRPPKLKTAMSMILKKLGEDYVRYFNDNSHCIINDSAIDLLEPINPRKKVPFFRT